MRLVLASGSPRRAEILTALGVEHTIAEPDVEEISEGDPEEVVVENARRKARAGLAEAADGPLVLGADTEVVLDGRVLGQPADEREARSSLEALSAQTHEVLTGVVLATSDGERSGVARSEVTFRDLDEGTLRLYLDSGEWQGRAGAYAIQGLGSILIARLEGDFSNVVGLPVPLLLKLAPELRANRAAADARASERDDR
ncbi:MAG TPA: nucleoside triphosphate pyrophosphatase [Solirubrobacterales bacterium]|nr:nucleoside triphosphate pyrophosphatase [Solirubrobacterales bacterium]